MSSTALPTSRPAASAISGAQRDQLIGWLTALAVLIHVVEAGIPSPLPGIKPGLANVVTLVVLMRYGIAAALWVGALRVVIGSLVIGTFMTPTFVLSATGAAASLALLALLASYNRVARPRWRLSCIGLGVAAAMAHMTAQFFAAWWVFVPHPGLWTLLPVLQAAALITGLATGWLAAALCARLAAHGAKADNTSL